MSGPAEDFAAFISERLGTTDEQESPEPPRPDPRAPRPDPSQGSSSVSHPTARGSFEDMLAHALRGAQGDGQGNWTPIDTTY